MAVSKSLIIKGVAVAVTVLVAAYSQQKKEVQTQEAAQQSAIAALGAKLRSLDFSGKPIGQALKSLKFSGKPLGQALKSLKFSGKPLGRIITDGDGGLPVWIWVVVVLMILARVFQTRIEAALA